jgi:hypothetical protein
MKKRKRNKKMRRFGLVAARIALLPVFAVLHSHCWPPPGARGLRPLAIFGFSCAGAPRRARSRARVVLITKHTDGDEPGLCIRGGWDLLYALL